MTLLQLYLLFAKIGFFTFGGSTVIMVFPPDTVRFDDDLVEHSAAGVETLVKVNSAIGNWV